MSDSIDQYSEENDSAETALKKINEQKLYNSVFMYHISNDFEFQVGAPIAEISGKYGLNDSEFEGPDLLLLSGAQNLAKTFKEK
jgi:effector-binding domain-containing protein